MTRLDRLIGNATGQSGRALRETLRTRRITINGTPASAPGHPVACFDRVELDDQVIQAKTPRYLALHKPAGHVSATTDSLHPTVIDLISEAWSEELHLAGRLDRFTTGLVILTNDSSFSESLTEPGRKVPKGYLVETEQEIPAAAIAAIRAGMHFAKEDITTHPAGITLESPCCCDLTIYEGKHHQIKRMFARFEIKVTKLHRYRVGGIWLDGSLAPGDYRELSEDERAGEFVAARLARR